MSCNVCVCVQKRSRACALFMHMCLRAVKVYVPSAAKPLTAHITDVKYTEWCHMIKVQMNSRLVQLMGAAKRW